MNELTWEPKAYGGGPLKGDNVTKFVHMDESGISHSEPFCVQAGVIVTADKQWKQVERRIAELLSELVPYKHSRDYIFHAKDIFAGTDEFYSRERFPDPMMRAAVVRQVASIASEFDLPVPIGFLEKSNFPRVLKWKSKKQIAEYFHALTYNCCAHVVESYMQQRCPEDEVAMLFVENNDAKNWISLLHKVNTVSGMIGEPSSFRNIATFKRIVEMPNFVSKSDSSLLQIADACAFIFNRHRRGLNFGDFMYEGFKDQAIVFEFKPPFDRRD